MDAREGKKWYESDIPEPWHVDVRIVEDRTVMVRAYCQADANRRARNPQNWEAVSDPYLSARISIKNGRAFRVGSGTVVAGEASPDTAQERSAQVMDAPRDPLSGDD